LFQVTIPLFFRLSQHKPFEFKVDDERILFKKIGRKDEKNMSIHIEWSTGMFDDCAFFSFRPVGAEQRKQRHRNAGRKNSRQERRDS
jgi:hypothetical protein